MNAKSTPASLADIARKRTRNALAAAAEEVAEMFQEVSDAVDMVRALPPDSATLVEASPVVLIRQAAFEEATQISSVGVTFAGVKPLGHETSAPFDVSQPRYEEESPLTIPAGRYRLLFLAVPATEVSVHDIGNLAVTEDDSEETAALKHIAGEHFVETIGQYALAEPKHVLAALAAAQEQARTEATAAVDEIRGELGRLEEGHRVELARLTEANQAEIDQLLQSREELSVHHAEEKRQLISTVKAQAKELREAAEAREVELHTLRENARKLEARLAETARQLNALQKAADVEAPVIEEPIGNDEDEDDSDDSEGSWDTSEDVIPADEFDDDGDDVADEESTGLSAFLEPARTEESEDLFVEDGDQVGGGITED